MVVIRWMACRELSIIFAQHCEKLMTNLRRKFKGKLNQKQNIPYTIPGLLGNSAGTVNVPNRNNYVYVRLAGSGVAEVFNNRVQTIYDLPVICGYDPIDPERFQVLSLQGSIAEAVGSSIIYGTGYAPSERYRWMYPGGGQDPLFSELRQIMPLRIIPTSSMSFIVHRQVIWNGTEWEIFGGSTETNLSSYVPTTSGKCKMVLVSIDEAGDIEITVGSEVDITALVPSDIPSPPDGTRYVLGAIRLYYGQTQIQEARTNTDVVDLRFPQIGGSDGYDVVIDHDHSGDSGDGGSFFLTNLSSNNAFDGQVATADGIGGIEWHTSKPEYFSGNISNPPTQAELISILGTAGYRGTGYSAILNDNGDWLRVYQVVSDGLHWWYFPVVKGNGNISSEIVGSTYSLANLVDTDKQEYSVSKKVNGVTYQVTAYWDSSGNMEFAKRVLPSTTWTTYDPSISITGADNHYFISLGIDSNGYIHLVYNMHNDSLVYRKSSNPIATFDGSFGSVLSMLGTNESAVSYPHFLHDPDDNLYFMFRDGTAGDGNTYLYTYDVSSGSWSASTGTSTNGLLINGKSSSPTQSAYLGQCRFDDDGNLHIAWVWREDTAVVVDGYHDVSYVKWNKTSFEKADGSAQTVPITIANCDIADNVAKGEVVDGFSGPYSPFLDVESDGTPHIIYWYKDVEGYRQIWHVHYDSGWVTYQITDDEQDSRPKIFAIDRETDIAYLLYNIVSVPNDILIKYSGSGDYDTWTNSELAPDDPYIGGGFDWQMWRDKGVLSMTLGKDLGDAINLLEWSPR